MNLGLHGWRHVGVRRGESGRIGTSLEFTFCGSILGLRKQREKTRHGKRHNAVVSRKSSDTGSCMVAGPI